MWCTNLQCTMLEVKAIDGLGMTIDMLVVNRYLREGDKAVFCTLDGFIVTKICSLLTPLPSSEMRIKSEYIHHKEIKGALGVKVISNRWRRSWLERPSWLLDLMTRWRASRRRSCLTSQNVGED
jgi:translation initiation factor IF-2